MNEILALKEAREQFPQVTDWHLACPVLPAAESTIDSASWLVLSRSGQFFAFVDGGPGPILMRRV